MPSATIAPQRSDHERMARKLFLSLWGIALIPLVLVGGSLYLYGQSVLHQPSTTLLANQINTALQVILLVLLVLAILMFIGIWLFVRRTLQPLQNLSRAAQNLAQENWAQPGLTQSRGAAERLEFQTRDEVGLLAQSFNQLADQNMELSNRLESQAGGYIDSLHALAQLAQLNSVESDRPDRLDQFFQQVNHALLKYFGCSYAAIYMVEASPSPEDSQASGETLIAARRQVAYSTELQSRANYRHADAPNPQASTDLLTSLNARPQRVRLQPFSRQSVSTPTKPGIVNKASHPNEIQTDLPTIISSAVHMGRTQINGLETFFTTSEANQAETANSSTVYPPSLVEAFIPIKAVLGEPGSETGSQAVNILPRADQVVGILDIIFAAPSAPTVNDTRLTEFQTIAALLASAMLRISSLPVRPESLAGRPAGGAIYPLPSAVDEAADTITPRRLAELQSLWAISQAITIETDLGTLYRVIHEQAVRVMGDIASFAIVLYDSTTGLIRIPYMLSSGTVRNIPPFPLGEGLSSIVIRSGKPLLLAKDTGERARALGAKFVGDPAKSWLGVPLILSNETIGLIIVQDTQNEERFNEEDQRLLSLIATQVAVVVRNARLLENTRRLAESERMVNEISDKIRRSIDIQSILKTTANELGAALNARRAHIEITLTQTPSNVAAAAGAPSNKVQVVDAALAAPPPEGRALPNNHRPDASSDLAAPGDLAAPDSGR